MKNEYKKLSYYEKSDLMNTAINNIDRERYKEVLDYNIEVGVLLVENFDLVEIYEIHYYKSVVNDDYMSNVFSDINSYYIGIEEVVKEFTRRIEKYI